MSPKLKVRKCCHPVRPADRNRQSIALPELSGGALAVIQSPFFSFKFSPVDWEESSRGRGPT